MEEIWKPVIGYEVLYQVSSFGRVKSFYAVRGRKEHILNQHHDIKGYLIVTLTNNKERKTIKVHRLVAGAFIENPNNYDQVNHINGVKDDNRVENLEWCNNSMNQRHAFDTGLSQRKRGKHNHARRVAQYLNDVLIKEYGCINDAVEAGYNTRSIYRSSDTGIRHRGFTWKILDLPKKVMKKKKECQN